MTKVSYIQNQGEWAYVVADDKTSLFTATTSFGNFSFVWRPAGRSQPLPEFLRNTNFDYFMEKTRGPERFRFNSQKTKDDLRTIVLRERRSRALNRHEAREIWLGLDEIEDTDSQEWFIAQMCENRDLMDILDEDWIDLVEKEYDPECVGFWETLWPAIIDEICVPVPA